MAEFESHGADYEEQHVHTVYEQIASHFSSTRYKPWPIVERFLKELSDGAVGADVGCGNGKYLAVNPRVFIIGSDCSTNLIKIAKNHYPHSAIVANNLNLPHPPHSFDFAISIAVVHHLSTSARRIEAVKAILELLRPASEDCPGWKAGRALIYVWALEQKHSRRGWDEGHQQDVMVPWVTKGKKDKALRKGSNEGPEEQMHDVGVEKQVEDKTFLRYYHLYRKDELEGDVAEAGGEVVESGYEKDNWWAIVMRKT